MLPRAAAALLLAAFFTPLGAQPPDSSARLRRLFPKPPAEFSTAPFFVWNGEVTERSIDQHLAEFRAQGIQAFFIHPRPGLITPYLSERWFSLIRYTVDQARKLGMLVWLYDENSYPSGFAGGHVPAEMPESYSEGQGLLLTRLEKPDPARNCAVLLPPGGKSGQYACFELVSYPKSPWHGGYSYVDLIRPGVTEKFIGVTMPGYQRALGRDLGAIVPGIFTDEPHIAPPRPKDCMRWTPDLFERFSRRWDYDLRPRLLSLFEETGDWRKLRHDYYAVLLELFIERWSKPWRLFADKNQIQWTGHYWEHDWPNPAHGPDNMAMYAFHDVPGIDMLFNQFDEGVNAQFGNVRSVKELASVANQLGRRRALSETYGGAGWELRFEDMKRLGDWEYALGVNLMNQHLAFQTIAGARKYDYPQSFTYHEPWWKHYHVLADYFARLSLALSSGEQRNRIVVLEPTTSAWMYASPGVPNPRMMEIGRQFQEFITRLEHEQVEYDLASESILKDDGKIAGTQLAIGRRAYDLLILPPGVENIERSTLRLMTAYANAGGKVLAFSEPALVDGAASEELAALAQSWERGSDTAALCPADITGVSGMLFHHRRRLSDGELLFLVNSSLDEPARATLRLGARSVVKLDPLRGTVAPWNSPPSIELPPAGSLLLLATPGPAARPRSEQTAEPREVGPAGPLETERLAPNALQIDYCDLTLAGTLEKELYFYNAAAKVFRFYGFDGNPWNTAVQYKTAILDRNHFPNDSGFEAAFHFELDRGVDRATLQAVVERPELWQVSVNGSAVAPGTGWWLDRAFGIYPIGPHTTAGRNSLSLLARPMSVHHELEPVYILGNFGVVPSGQGWRLVPAQALTTGAWKELGLPFYSNSVSYRRLYHLQRGRYRVQLGNWRGTVAEVKVNGKSAGIIGWRPYEVEIGDLVTDGENRIEVIVTGSLKNLLGPHHGKINRGLVSPWAFRSAPAKMPPGSTYDLEPYGLLEDFRLLAY